MHLKRDCLKHGRWPTRFALVGCCAFLVIAALAGVRADPPEEAPDAGPMPDMSPTTAQEQPETVPSTTTTSSTATPATPATGAGYPQNAQDYSQNNNSPQNSDNTSSNSSDDTDNNAPAPNAPGPGNTVNPNSPLLPSQALNTSPLYTSPGANGVQTSVLSAPALYNTGAFDLSQVSSNNALAQAFMQTGMVSSEENPGEEPSPLDRIRIGPVDLKTALNFSIIGDDNIDAQPAGKDRVHDVSFTLTPAVLVEYGAHEGQKGFASIVYSPVLQRFAHYSAQNSDNQNVALNLQYPFQRLTLNATETYAETTGVNLDARARTTETTDVATFGGSYEIDDKLSVLSNLEYLDTSYSGTGTGSGSTTNSSANSDNGSGGLLGETRESWNTALSYHLTDKLTLGPGVNIGIESPQDSPQQTFEQGLVNINYQPTEKIALFGQGGVEWRQYSGGASDTNPVFSAGINYAPRDETTLTLSGYQNVEPTSDNSSQTDVNTGVAVAGSERLFQKLTVAFSFIYSHTEYTANGGSTTPARATTTVSPFSQNANGSNQDNYVYRPSLTYVVNQWSTLALYYQYQGNVSSGAASSYHDNSLGFSVSAQF